MNKQSKILALMLGLTLSCLNVFAMTNVEGQAQSDKMVPPPSLTRAQDYATKSALLKLNLFKQSANPELRNFGLSDEVFNEVRQHIMVAVLHNEQILYEYNIDQQFNEQITKIVLNNLPQNIKNHLNPGWLAKVRRAAGLYEGPSKRLFQTLKLAAHNFYSRNCFLVNSFLEITATDHISDYISQEHVLLFRQCLEIQKQHVSNSQDQEILQIMINAIDAKIRALLQSEQFTQLTPEQPTNKIYADILLKIFEKALTESEEQIKKLQPNLNPKKKLIRLMEALDTVFKTPLDIKNTKLFCQNIESAFALFLAVKLQTQIFMYFLNQTVHNIPGGTLGQVETDQEGRSFWPFTVSDSPEYKGDMSNNELTALSQILGEIPTTPDKMSLSKSQAYNEFNNKLQSLLKRELTSDTNLKTCNYLARYALTFVHQNPWLVYQYIYGEQKQTLQQTLRNNMELQQQFYKDKKNAFKAKNIVVQGAIRVWNAILRQEVEADLNYKMLDKMIRTISATGTPQPGGLENIGAVNKPEVDDENVSTIIKPKALYAPGFINLSEQEKEQEKERIAERLKTPRPEATETEQALQNIKKWVDQKPPTQKTHQSNLFNFQNLESTVEGQKSELVEQINTLYEQQELARRTIREYLLANPANYISSIEKIQSNETRRVRGLKIKRLADKTIAIQLTDRMPKTPINFDRDTLIKELQDLIDAKALKEGLINLKKGLDEKMQQLKEAQAQRLTREQEKENRENTEFGPFQSNIPEYKRKEQRKEDLMTDERLANLKKEIKDFDKKIEERAKALQNLEEERIKEERKAEEARVAKRQEKTQAKEKSLTKQRLEREKILKSEHDKQVKRELKQKEIQRQKEENLKLERELEEKKIKRQQQEAEEVIQQQALEEQIKEADLEREQELKNTEEDEFEKAVFEDAITQDESAPEFAFKSDVLQNAKDSIETTLKSDSTQYKKLVKQIKRSGDTRYYNSIEIKKTDKGFTLRHTTKFPLIDIFYTQQQLEQVLE